MYTHANRDKNIQIKRKGEEKKNIITIPKSQTKFIEFHEINKGLQWLVHICIL